MTYVLITWLNKLYLSDDCIQFMLSDSSVRDTCHIFIVGCNQVCYQIEGERFKHWISHLEILRGINQMC